MNRVEMNQDPDGRMLRKSMRKFWATNTPKLVLKIVDYGQSGKTGICPKCGKLINTENSKENCVYCNQRVNWKKR